MIMAKLYIDWRRDAVSYRLSMQAGTRRDAAGANCRWKCTKPMRRLPRRSTEPDVDAYRHMPIRGIATYLAI